MVAFFADRQRNEEAITGRRKRAGGKCRVRAGRILEAIEIQNKLAGFVEAIGRETGVEKAAGGVRRGGAGGVTQDEE